MAAKKKKRDVGSGKARKDKLGVKAGQTVKLVGAHDDALRADVAALGASVTTKDDADWILWALAGPADVAKMNALRASMRDDAAIWAVWTKGKAELREGDIRDHALRIDLVDVKVMSWSDTHSGLKLVVRKSQRKT